MQKDKNNWLDLEEKIKLYGFEPVNPKGYKIRFFQKNEQDILYKVKIIKVDIFLAYPSVLFKSAFGATEIKFGEINLTEDFNKFYKYVDGLQKAASIHIDKNENQDFNTKEPPIQA